MKFKPTLSLVTLLYLGSLATPGIPGAGSVAVAQDNMLEEVVVTARKRSENLMDVPQTVNVFSAETIETAHIERAADFFSLTPNAMLLDIQDTGAAFMTIRGITSNRNTEQAVAILYDGVLTTSPNAFTQELFDVQQIEVVKGPQGALYGRNAIGGAILITTKQPTNETEGKIVVGTGNGSRKKVQGVVSGPIVEDKLLYRVSGSYLDFDGVHENVFLGGTVDPYEDKSGRVRLLWTPNDVFSADFRYQKSKQDAGSINFKVTSRFYDSQALGIPGQIPPGCVPDPRPCDLFGDANLTVEDLPFNSNIVGTSQKDLDTASLKLDWDVGWATITSTTAYDTVDVWWGGDLPVYFSPVSNSYGPDAALTNSQQSTSKAWSQEIRFTSQTDGPLSWIAGGYYVDNDREVASIVGLDTDSIVVDNGFDLIQFGNPNPTVGYTRDAQNIEAWALFGQLAYDVSDNVELALALRYDEDTRTITSKTPARFISPLAASLGQFEGQTQSNTFDKLQPKASIRWQPTDNSTYYASYGVGFRAGGYNQTGIAVAVAGEHDSLTYEQRVQVPENISDLYDQEETQDFEIGGKWDLLDRTLRLNVALFNTEVTDKQFFVFLATSQVSAQTLLNIDEVTLRGFEVDATWSPTENLDLFGAYGYIDSNIDAYTANQDYPTIGNHAPYVPEYTLNLGAQYSAPIGDSMEIVARVDYQRLGPTYWQPEEFVVRDPVNLWNGRIALQSANGTWSLAAWGKNLGEELYNAESDGPYGFIHPAPLRTYGVDLTFRF